MVFHLGLRFVLDEVAGTGYVSASVGKWNWLTAVVFMNSEPGKRERHSVTRMRIHFLLIGLAMLIGQSGKGAPMAGFELSEGGIVRGPKGGKKIALEFTGHTFAEGGEAILNELARHQAKAAFFLTGDFLDNPKFKPLVRRIIEEGHYIGPHSDKHLLYCPWDGPKKTLVTRADFDHDLFSNYQKIGKLKVRPKFLYWLPAYEWYNQEIVDWGKAGGFTLVNYTPGTRSNADYTEDAATNFVSSKAIFESIVRKEQADLNGLNGFLLLMHIGVGPGRTDKMHDRLGELLDYLSGKGYQFVRVDELLNPK